MSQFIHGTFLLSKSVIFVVIRYILQFTDLCGYPAVSLCFLVFQFSFFLHKNQMVFTALWRTFLLQHCTERHFNISCEIGDRNIRHLVARMQETKKKNPLE